MPRMPMGILFATAAIVALVAVAHSLAQEESSNMTATPGAPGTPGSPGSPGTLAPSTPSTQPAPVAPALNFTLKDIDGKEVPLSRYQGQTILVVNVASKCGNTPQYQGLEEIYIKYKDRGFVVLGFPANNFGGQEPGTDEQIKTFCTLNYQINFPMFSKISVKGADQAPFYAHLTSQETSPQPKGDITWNFEKFLIGRDGRISARFTPKTQPTDPKLIAAIEADLAKPRP